MIMMSNKGIVWFLYSYISKTYELVKKIIIIDESMITFGDLKLAILNFS